MDHITENKTGYIHIFCGIMGTGKTSLTRKFIMKKPKSCYIYDINNDYTDIETLDNDLHDELPQRKEFISQANRIENGIIIYEEASLFFGTHSRDEEMIEQMIRCRHKGNYVILQFHSMMDIPRYIWSKAKYFTMFKTADDIGFVAQKFRDKNIIETFTTVQKQKNKHFHKTIERF